MAKRLVVSSSGEAKEVTRLVISDGGEAKNVVRALVSDGGVAKEFWVAAASSYFIFTSTPFFDSDSVGTGLTSCGFTWSRGAGNILIGCGGYSGSQPVLDVAEPGDPADYEMMIDNWDDGSGGVLSDAGVWRNLDVASLFWNSTTTISGGFNSISGDVSVRPVGGGPGDTITKSFTVTLTGV